MSAHSPVPSPSRRHMLQTGGAAIIVSATPTLAACESCDTECVASLIQLAVFLAKTSFEIYEDITGRIVWENRDETFRRIQTLVCLIRDDDGSCIQEEEFIVEIPSNGTYEYDLGGFSTELEGLYYFLIKFLGREEPSEDFDVTV